MKELSTLTFVMLVASFVQGQYFHPNVEDKKYLDRIETDVAGDTLQAKKELIQQARIVEEVAKVYIGAKLKQNLFKALRVLAEKELESNPTPSWAQFRQQEEEEEEDEDSTSSSGSNSTNIFPNVANLVKAIFGGNSINLTSYVQSATKFLPQSVGNQVLGVVKLLAHNPSPRISTTVATTQALKVTTTSPRNEVTPKSENTEAPLVKVQPVSSPPNSTGNSTTRSTLSVSATTSKAGPETTSIKPTTPEEDEEEEEEDTRAARQLKLPELGDLPGFNLLGSFFNGNSDATSKPKASSRNATTESPSGFEEEKEVTGANGVNGLNLDSIAQGIRMGFGDLIKVVPDLFKGAREAVGLLSGIQNLLGSFGGLGGRMLS